MNRLGFWEIGMFGIVLFAGAVLPLYAQDYGNEWIDYSQTYFRVEVGEAGIYRIPYSVLDAHPDIDLNNIDGANFQLFYMGEEVPIYVGDGSNEVTGSLSPGDFIEFYGNSRNAEFDDLLYADPQWHPHTFSSFFSDTAIYFLTWNDQTNNARMAVTNNNLSSPPAQETHFMHIGVRYFHNIGSRLHKMGINNASTTLHLSAFVKGEGRVHPSNINNSRSYSVSTPNKHTSGTVVLEAGVVGNQTTNNEFTVTVGSSTTPTQTLQNHDFKRVNLSLSLSDISSSTDVEFTVFQGRIRVSYITITYPRQFDLDGASRFAFELAGNTNDRYLVIDDFNDKGTVPLLYDRTHRYRIAGSTGSPHEFVLPVPPNGDNRKLFLSSQHAQDIHTVSTLEKRTFVDYSDPANQGNFIIVSHPLLRTGQDYVQQYANYRHRPSDSLYAMVVDILALYDQFAYGIKYHPLSIRHFVHFAVDNFNVEPAYLFLIGQGLHYARWGQGNHSDFMLNHNYAKNCLVPTHGFPASDNMLAAVSSSDYRPLLAVGRLATDDPQEVNIYLDKVKELETHQQIKDQRLEAKAWMKQVLHFGGGSNAGEQNLFRNYLNGYKQLIEGIRYGGKVHSFFKTSSNPVQIPTSEKIDSLLSNGVSLMTYFGHSGGGTFDYSVDNPDQYNNKGKYPCMLINGCYAGDIHLVDESILSKRFVKIPDKGAIAFLAALDQSVPHVDNLLSNAVYNNISKKQYGASFGMCYKEAVWDIYSTNSQVLQQAVQQFTFHGDPAVKVNPHDKPDYVITPNGVQFKPDQLTADLDSFEVHVTITNIGEAVSDSFRMWMERVFPDNSRETYVKERSSTIYKDKVVFRLPMEPDLAAGLNLFNMRVDWDPFNAEGQIDEIENIVNNELTITQIVQSMDAIPIWPYPESIFPRKQVTLKASTVNPFAPARKYLIELDTTRLFNSAVKQSTSVTQSGGVVSWTPPGLIDNVVYYWRISPDTAHVDNLSWKSSSFIYIPNGPTGWNQSHCHQFAGNNMVNIEMNDNCRLQFVEGVKEIELFNVLDGHPDWDVAKTGWFLNGAKAHGTIDLRNGFCTPGGGGVTIVVIDSTTGLPWESYREHLGWNRGRYGERHCNGADDFGQLGFDFADNEMPPWWPDPDENFRESQYNFLDTIPCGAYMLVYGVATGGGHRVEDYADSIKQRYEQLGFTEVWNVKNKEPFGFFTQKCVSGSPTIQEVADSALDVINFTVDITGQWHEGRITTDRIGPSGGWDRLEWDYEVPDAGEADEFSLDIIGITPGGREEVLFTGIQNKTVSLNSVHAREYPYLKLRLHSKDDSLFTPIQLKYWRVLYQPYPEAALNAHAHFKFHDDSLHLGETGSFAIAIDNVSDYVMDSLFTEYRILSGGKNQTLKYPRQDSIAPKKRQISKVTFITHKQASVGQNVFLVDVNSANDQPERFRFNNMGFLPFYVFGDHENPLLDVTFDGRRILDGDIVSAEPHILIKLKDENEYLAMNDTTLMSVHIKHPDEQDTRRISYNQEALEFVPATGDLSKDNSAEIHYTPRFTQDGIYELTVQGRDRADNVSGKLDYKITFEVVTEASITNVLNYPNPFTTSTRFVFTLTGHRVPDYFKIQIMTISGKVVREVTMDELGPIRVGPNITDYTWDGRDEFGDRLANGVYLYRVVAKLDGEDMDHRETAADKFFKSGMGKMYLMR